MSSVYKKQRKFADAEDVLLKSLELKPDFNTAYNSLGTTYYSWGKFDKAVENFTKFHSNADSKKLKDRAAKYIGLAYTKLGESALKDRDYEGAEKQLLNAVSNYNYDAAYLKLADVYVETGKYEEALKAADNAINYRDKKSKVPKGAPYFYKGLAFKGLNDKEKAKENFKIASSDKQYRDRSNHEIKYLN
jgi:tetratricopeptide (TPR) repeat protein